MSSLFILFSLLPWFPAFLCRVTTEQELEVLEGRSLTIPCHYEPQYASYVKYWCQGKMREFCTSLARTDETRLISPTEDKVSISDDPVQQVFTVTMNNLKEGDTGWYMCGVEIGGMWNADDSAFTHIKVIHGMSVVNSRVSGEEGGSVTVECLYSERYRESEKKWRRSGDWSSSLLTGSEGSYEDTSVAISDDRTGAFTVTLKKLQMRDTGWYWCSAGQQQIAVHVLVTPRPTTTAASMTSPPTPSQSVEYLSLQKSITSSWYYHSPIWVPVVVCFSLILLLGLALFYMETAHVGIYTKKNKAKTGRFTKYSGDTGDMENAAVVFFSKDSQDVQIY